MYSLKKELYVYIFKCFLQVGIINNTHIQSFDWSLFRVYFLIKLGQNVPSFWSHETFGWQLSRLC